MGQRVQARSEPVSRPRMISGASSGVTLAYMLAVGFDGDQRTGAAQAHAADAS